MAIIDMKQEYEKMYQKLASDINIKIKSWGQF